MNSRCAGRQGIPGYCAWARLFSIKNYNGIRWINIARSLVASLLKNPSKSTAEFALARLPLPGK